MFATTALPAVSTLYLESNLNIQGWSMSIRFIWFNMYLFTVRTRFSLWFTAGRRQIIFGEKKYHIITKVDIIMTYTSYFLSCNVPFVRVPRGTVFDDAAACLQVTMMAGRVGAQGTGRQNMKGKHWPQPATCRRR